MIPLHHLWFSVNSLHSWGFLGNCFWLVGWCFRSVLLTKIQKKSGCTHQGRKKKKAGGRAFRFQKSLSISTECNFSVQKQEEQEEGLILHCWPKCRSAGTLSGANKLLTLTWSNLCCVSISPACLQFCFFTECRLYRTSLFLIWKEINMIPPHLLQFLDWTGWTGNYGKCSALVLEKTSSPTNANTEQFPRVYCWYLISRWDIAPLV